MKSEYYKPTFMYYNDCSHFLSYLEEKNTYFIFQTKSKLKIKESTDTAICNTNTLNIERVKYSVSKDFYK